MKLSNETMSVLKNFNELNPNLLIEKGNEVKTITVAQNVMTHAVLAEKFPCQVAIYDMTKFLGIVSLFDDPDFDFGKKSVTISDEENGSYVYRYAKPEVLNVANREVKFPDPLATFTLSKDALASLKKISAVMKVEDLRFESKDGKLSATLMDKKEGGDVYSIELDSSSEVDFTLHFRISNLLILAGDYTVEIANKAAHFVNDGEKINLEYWIALEADSVVEETTEKASAA